MQAEIDKYLRCAVDSHHGVYAPQEFVNRFRRWIEDVDPADLDTVQRGPDDPDYWQAWEAVALNATVRLDGHRWFIWEDGDIWLVRKDSPAWVLESL